MFYSQVVNLPTANTPYLIRTLLVALDANAPVVLGKCLIRALATNTDPIAIGTVTMATVDDGNRLETNEASTEEGREGFAFDTSAEYLIAAANNQKALIQGHTY